VYDCQDILTKESSVLKMTEKLIIDQSPKELGVLRALETLFHTLPNVKTSCYKF
jgi:hypothetical protein